MSAWSLIGLSGIGLVLTIGLAVMPVWSSSVVFLIGVFFTFGGAFTPISWIGEALAFVALLGLAVRSTAYLVRYVRHHRDASAPSA